MKAAARGTAGARYGRAVEISGESFIQTHLGQAEDRVMSEDSLVGGTLGRDVFPYFFDHESSDQFFEIRLVLL